MDFIKDLLEDNDCNTIFVCIEKLKNSVQLVPCATGEGKLSAAAAAATVRLFIQHIVRYFGVLG